MHNGCQLFDEGFIGFSKKRRNQVISNVVGAAAYNGSAKILKHMMPKKSLADINHIAKEIQDFNSKGAFSKEFSGYSPLMLSVAGGGQNIECTQLLCVNKADLSVEDPIGNSVLHVAALHSNNQALEYLVKVWPEKSLA